MAPFCGYCLLVSHKIVSRNGTILWLLFNDISFDGDLIYSNYRMVPLREILFK